MTRKIDLTPNLRLTDSNGRLTAEAAAVLQQMSATLRNLEERVEALEP